MPPPSIPCADAEVREILTASLRLRRGEIDEEARTQVSAILGAKQIEDPEYVEGLRAAIEAGLDFGLEVLGHGRRRTPSVPPQLLMQARLAARNRLQLDTVLRRYFAGYSLLDEFIHDEATRAGVDGQVLASIIRTQRTAFNELLGVITEEYGRETVLLCRSEKERLAERVQGVVDGEPPDTSDIPYDFTGQHLGLVARGAGAPAAIQEIARTLDRRPLIVPKPEGVVWAWLGSKQTQGWADIEAAVKSGWPKALPLALGEMGRAVNGWRLTHRQARAVFPIALRLPEAPARYADVALEASMAQDDLLLASLKQLYLEPLAEHRKRGKELEATLRAFFESNRSVSDTAAKLDVRWHTVKDRIDAYEELIGQPLDVCAKAVWAALRLRDLGYMTPR